MKGATPLDFDTADLGLVALLINAGCNPEHLGDALTALDEHGGKELWQALQAKVHDAIDVALVRSST
jgi:hypothetical protein